jgi:hypothetical protein
MLVGFGLVGFRHCVVILVGIGLASYDLVELEKPLLGLARSRRNGRRLVFALEPVVVDLGNDDTPVVVALDLDMNVLTYFWFACTFACILLAVACRRLRSARFF